MSGHNVPLVILTAQPPGQPDREGRTAKPAPVERVVLGAYREHSAQERDLRGIPGSKRTADAGIPDPADPVTDADTLRTPDGHVWRVLVRRTPISTRLDLSREATK